MNEQFEQTVATGVHEYCEGYDVVLKRHVSDIRWMRTRPGHGRWVVRALNEAGYNSTEVDVVELLGWLKVNRPDLCVEAGLQAIESAEIVK